MIKSFVKNSKINTTVCSFYSKSSFTSFIFCLSSSQMAARSLRTLIHSGKNSCQHKTRAPKGAPVGIRSSHLNTISTCFPMEFSFFGRTYFAHGRWCIILQPLDLHPLSTGITAKCARQTSPKVSK